MMKKNSTYSLLLLIIPAVWGCNKTSISDPLEYVMLVNKMKPANTISVMKNDLQFSACYLPIEYLAIISLDSTEGFEKNYRSLFNEYKGAEYYEYTISKEEKNSKRYLQEINSQLPSEDFETYISFNIQNDFSLIIDNDTIPCSYLHREISDAITNKIKYTLVFTLNQKDSISDRVVYLNSEILNLKDVNILISNYTISLTPPFKIKL